MGLERGEGSGQMRREREKRNWGGGGLDGRVLQHN